VDAFALDCENGNMAACDELFTTNAEMQTFFDYGFTCGERLTEEEVAERFCVDIYPDA